MPLPVDGRMCVTDPRRPRSPRMLLLRVEMWLCRWWSEAREAGLNGEAAEVWGAALIVSEAARSMHPPTMPAGSRYPSRSSA